MITEMSRPARLSPPQPTSNNCSLGWAGLAGGGDTEEMLIAGDPDSDLRQPSTAQPSPATTSPCPDTAVATTDSSSLLTFYRWKYSLLMT